MKTYRNLYMKLCSYENLELAFRKAKKGKSSKRYVLDFESKLVDNLLELRSELLLHSYRPKPLQIFILRDPQTRIIGKSDFRDRVVHHALCNIIEPIFEKIFICDSYANRKGKGVHKAIQRFDYFKRKISCNGRKRIKGFDNNDVIGYVLKADIKHYFEEVDHAVLLAVLGRKIKDEKVLWLIRIILSNHKTKINGKGMPLSNLTSQFFANVYLNELDLFIKHKLKAKYYLRYVDDFVILFKNKEKLDEHKEKISNFLSELKLELHPDKSKIISLGKGVSLLGYRIFYNYRLLRKSNVRKFSRKFSENINLAGKGLLPYDWLLDSMQGWFSYAMWANTYNLRKNIAANVEKNSEIAFQIMILKGGLKHRNKSISPNQSPNYPPHLIF